MQAQVTPNMKRTQIPGPALPTEGRSQKEEGIQPSSLGKGDLRRSKLGEKRQDRNMVQMKEQGRNSPDQKLSSYEWI